MSTQTPIQISSLEFMVLAGDILASAGTNCECPEHALECIRFGLGRIEQACIDIAQELTEPIVTGVCLGGKEYAAVTKTIPGDQQIGLYIRESAEAMREGGDTVTRHWSEYPEELLTHLTDLLIMQISMWHALARDFCVADGSMITPFDKPPADAE